MVTREYLFCSFFAFGVTLAMLRGSSWLYTPKLFLAVLRGQYGILGIEPGSVTYKANALPAILLLQPHHYFFSENTINHIFCISHKLGDQYLHCIFLEIRILEDTDSFWGITGHSKAYHFSPLIFYSSDGNEVKAFFFFFCSLGHTQ